MMRKWKSITEMQKMNQSPAHNYEDQFKAEMKRATKAITYFFYRQGNKSNYKLK